MLASGCGGRQQFNNTGADRAALLRDGPPLAMTQVLVLEQAGVAPTDTSVTYETRMGRTIVMRHVPPDNAVFMTLTIPADSTATGETTIQLVQSPGQYGITATASPAWPKGAHLTFSYAIHFQAPAGIEQHYLGRSFYEAALGIGMVTAEGKLDFEETTRPAADMVRAPAAAAGQYLVAAPR